jgi:hypothetical protein
MPLIISSFKDHKNLSIRVILTKSACHFLAGQSLEQPTVSSLASLANVDGVYFDEDEWSQPWTRHSEILHIELRRWARLLAIGKGYWGSLRRPVRQCHSRLGHKAPHHCSTGDEPVDVGTPRHGKAIGDTSR